MLKKLSLSLTLSFALQVWAGPMTVIENSSELDRYMKDSDFNGVVYVAKNKSTLLKKALGVKDFISRTPLTTEDRFQIGSVSKQFVPAASLLKLQEEGKLSLDDELTKFFPEQTRLQNIKVRNILNHTAGLKNYTDQEDFWKMTEGNRLLTLLDISEYIFSLPFDFEVGTQWNYSNSGYILAGMIVEKLTGETWDHYIERNFLSPLKMSDSGYNVHFEEASDVVGHMQDEGQLVPIVGFSLSWALSAGALYSTLEDLAKWTQIYDESSLLNSKSKKEMQTAFLGDYGLGVWIKNYRGQTLITHSGRTPGFVTKLHYVKESKLNVVTFNNTDGNGPDLSSVLLDFYTIGKAAPLKTKLFPMSEETLAQFVGTFKQGDFSVRVYLEEGKLLLFPDGQKPFLMKPVDTDSFNLEGFAGEEFLRDSEGKVIALRHYQNGGSSIFNKISEKASPLALTTLLPKMKSKNHPIQQPIQFRDF